MKVPDRHARTASLALMRSKETRLYEELGAMVLDALSALGFATRQVWDGDPEGIDGDVLFLFGNGRGFERYANLLHGRKDARPQTILWQIEPLPPANLSPRTERLALQAESCDRGWLGESRSARIVKKLVPVAARAHLQKQLQILLTSRFNRRIVRELPAQSEAPNPIIIRRYEWLQRRHAEGWLDCIFASTMAKANFLNSRGIPAVFCPFGYHPSMGTDLGRERDIDVLFIGGASEPRRAQILTKLKHDLQARGVTFEIVTDACFGQKRTELINRTRIFLNLANYRWDISAERFLFGIACGALIVSEELGDTTPYVPGEHFVHAKTEDLAEQILFYLHHCKERETIVQTAWQFLTQQLTLAKSVASMFTAGKLEG